jgi:cysteine-rich repeat protein
MVCMGLLRSHLLRVACSLAALQLASLAPETATALCLAVPGDVDQSGNANVGDVACTLLAVRWQIMLIEKNGNWLLPTCAGGDVALVFEQNCDGVIDISDAILVIHHALAQPLSPLLDANQDGCHDACEPLDCECGNQLREVGEQCDPGLEALSDVIADRCRTTCELPKCGDATVDTNEQCDDGNATNGDGCEEDCVVTGGAGAMLPYVEGFDAAGAVTLSAVPWRVESKYGDSGNNWTLATVGPLGPDPHIRYVGQPAGTSYITRIVSPPLNASTATSLTLTFEQTIALSNAAGNGGFRVFVSKDNGATWTKMSEHNANLGGLPPTQSVVDLSAVAAGQSEVRIAFELSSTAPLQVDYWDIDNIQVQ